MNIKRTNKLKTNSSGFGHIEMLLLVVAVVVIGGVGFFVYQNQNKKTASKSTAHAGGYTTIGPGWPVKVSACKTYNSAWGGFYAVKVLVTKEASTPAYGYDIYDQNGITLISSQRTTSNAYYAGTVATVTIYMSVANKDIVWIGISPWVGIAGRYFTIYPGNFFRASDQKGINQITNC